LREKGGLYQNVQVLQFCGEFSLFYAVMARSKQGSAAANAADDESNVDSSCAELRALRKEQDRQDKRRSKRPTQLWVSSLEEKPGAPTATKKRAEGKAVRRPEADRLKEPVDVVYVPTREPPQRHPQADLGVDRPDGRVERLAHVARFQQGPNVLEDLVEDSERVRDAVRPSKFGRRERADVLRPRERKLHKRAITWRAEGPAVDVPVEPLRPPIFPGPARHPAIGENDRCDDAPTPDDGVEHRRSDAQRRQDARRRHEAAEGPHRKTAHFFPSAQKQRTTKFGGFWGSSKKT
jgi:hypothetical protein